MVSLPDTALVENDSIYVIKGDRLQKKQVEVIKKNGTTILIRGEVFEGDLAVTRAFPEISPGLRVSLQ